MLQNLFGEEVLSHVFDDVGLRLEVEVISEVV